MFVVLITSLNFNFKEIANYVRVHFKIAENSTYCTRVASLFDVFIVTVSQTHCIEPRNYSSNYSCCTVNYIYAYLVNLSHLIHTNYVATYEEKHEWIGMLVMQTKLNQLWCACGCIQNHSQVSIAARYTKLKVKFTINHNCAVWLTTGLAFLWDNSVALKHY